MSIRFILAALNARVGSSGAKLVLIKLADNANDSGVCYPSMKYIAQHTELSPRAVQTNIRKLESLGFLTVEHRTHEGVNLPNVYHLDIAKMDGEKPAGVVQNLREGGAESADKPVNEPVSLNLPPIIPQPVQKPKAETFQLPDWIPADAWNGFVEMRKKIRKPLTGRAVAGIIKKLDGFRAAGGDPGAILDQSTERCWSGVFEIKQEFNRNGNRTDTRSRERRNRDTWNETLAEIAGYQPGGYQDQPRPGADPEADPKLL